LPMVSNPDRWSRTAKVNEGGRRGQGRRTAWARHRNPRGRGRHLPDLARERMGNAPTPFVPLRRSLENRVCERIPVPTMKAGWREYPGKK
jgi:hypothetical protein